MSTWLKSYRGKSAPKKNGYLGQMGAGGNGHWSRWALEQTGTWGRMGDLICPKCPRTTFSQCPFTPSAHLPQRLFTSKPICPGANLPRCLLFASAHFFQVSICIRLVLHLSLEPICSGTHFPGAHFSQMSFWSHTKTFVPMRSHRVL